MKDVCLRCRWNLKLWNFRFSVWQTMSKNWLKCVPHVQHHYFSSFNQSDHCFLVSSLPLLSFLLKLSIASWCCTNKLLINPDKTKLILFGTKQLLSKVPDIRVPFIGQHLTPVSSVKDLGIILDSNHTFNEQVNTLTSSLLSILCQISKVRHLFS